MREANEGGDDMDVDGIPSSFICPITQKIMDDPVFTRTGNTYDRKAIEKWLKERRTDPLTNEELEVGPDGKPILTPNNTLRSDIFIWRDQNNR
eukprot:SAG31_NODE_6702_length_1918_cov_1.561297_1_plen_93_part_00